MPDQNLREQDPGNARAPRSSRLMRYALHRYWRFSRGMTLGVRAVILDDQDAVFLVRHTYVAGWHLPGGGVEPGETLLQSLERELVEEGNIVLDARPALHGIFFNRKASDRDHVAIFIVRDFHQTAPRGKDRELAETGFFPLTDLPDGTTPATRRRIAEVCDDLAPIDDWSD